MKKINYIKIVLIIITFFVNNVAIGSDGLSLYDLSNTVNNNDRQVWGRGWAQKVAYNETDVVDCEDLNAADSTSSCVAKINVYARNMHYPYKDKIAYKKTIKTIGAKGVLLALKAKAWAQEKGSYCQINLSLARDLDGISKADHALTVEAFGDDNYILSGRNIKYNTIPVLVNENGDFFMLSSKEIFGKCEVSVAINVIGFFK